MSSVGLLGGTVVQVAAERGQHWRQAGEQFGVVAADQSIDLVGQRLTGAVDVLRKALPSARSGVGNDPLRLGRGALQGGRRLGDRIGRGRCCAGGRLRSSISDLGDKSLQVELLLDPARGADCQHSDGQRLTEEWRQVDAGHLLRGERGTAATL